MKIAVLGGGAAGFFSAISCKTHHPGSEVILYERSVKLLAKVKVSGGGRCNVTNACQSLSELAKQYPRGGKQLKQAFLTFNNKHTVEWFEARGVKLKTEDDQRIFPVTNNSQTIVDCLMSEAAKLGIEINTNSAIQSLEKTPQGFSMNMADERIISVDKVIVATGGSPKPEGFDWLAQLGHEIVSPVPSLFTFNIPGDPVTKLMGVSADHVSVKTQGTKLKQEGPLLITHWGMSGPAVLKLSAWGARTLKDLNYQFKIHVNWTGTNNENELREFVSKEFQKIKQKNISNSKLVEIPSRLWLYLVHKSGIDPEWKWNSISKESFNKLVNTLTNDEYEVRGKTTFKEEFVTCGGVSLDQVNFQTMESKVCPGMYFAGEVLDIDGVTGGFNFQAAWTTGFIAGKLHH